MYQTLGKNAVLLPFPTNSFSRQSTVRVSKDVVLRRLTVKRTAGTQDKQGSFMYGQVSAVEDDSDFFTQNADVLRQLPTWTGAMGFALVLVNRLVSGIAPVIDASSAQSRADVLCVVCSAILVLTGLNWLSLTPKPPPEVELNGEMSEEVEEKLPETTKLELQWAYRAISSATRCQSMVVFFQERAIFQSGIRKRGCDISSISPGKICAKALESSMANYLPNLQLYPGAVEFLAFLPPNTQGVVVQPLGDEGLLVVGTNTQRGVGRLDQAWLSAVADKLGATLDMSS